MENSPGGGKVTGGEAVIRTLRNGGVDTMFGIISIHMLPIYDAMRADPDLRLIIPRHEMSGGFMADGYARATGRPGIYLSSTGPGAANTMGAVIESWYVQSRTLQLTSEIQTQYHNKFMLHEVKDQAGMFKAVGAHCIAVDSAAGIAPAIHSALQALNSPRVVPQIVQIPIDQQFAQTTLPPPTMRRAIPPAPSETAIRRAAALLARAKRPAVWIGGGVLISGGQAELLRLVEALGAPVFTTRGGRGAISEDHPQILGNYFGERPAREFIEKQCDCLLAVGTKFSWHSTNEWRIKLPDTLIRVDIEFDQLQHNYPAEVGIHADASLALAGIAGELEAMRYERRESYLGETAALKAALREEFRKHRPLTADLMDRIDRAAPPERILVTDSTIPAYWGANQYLPVRADRGFMTPRLAAIGPGYPMALGAQAADRARPVLCIVGDGGFSMHMSEMIVAAEEGLNVVCMVFNNKGYGILKRLQNQMMGGRVFAVDLKTPDFVTVARGLGVDGEAATTPEEVEAAVRRGFEARAPYLIEVQAPFES